ncbi:PREDICTED: BAHD acyltransferase At5g47980-like [Fragaria vesca subsp. vesca]
MAIQRGRDMKMKCGGRRQMNTDIEVEVIYKETITPSSPTPPHLKCVDLSVFDQIVPETYIPLLLFYPSLANPETDTDHQSLVAEKSSILKASLSKTLTHFYPLAGKFQYNNAIICDDHGVAFIASRKLKYLFPAAVESTHLLLVQVNFFECGGMAIVVNILHKVADAFTLSTFLKSWAAASLGSSSSCTTHDHPVLPPKFGSAASLYPSQDFLNSRKPDFVGSVQEKCTRRRFVFDASRIVALKSKCASPAVPHPTRVEVVSALIWKCAMDASRSNLGVIRPSSWSQAVNMRKRRSGHAFTENLMGNFVWSYTAAMTVNTEVDLQSLVATFRKCKEDYEVNFPNGVTAELAYQKIKESWKNLAKEGIDNYGCTSWCWFPFYETNFGWGKPSWVSTRGFQVKNTVVLMDAKDGDGIEASLTFIEEKMAIFESNQELLAYASLNPSVI